MAPYSHVPTDLLGRPASGESSPNDDVIPPPRSSGHGLRASSPPLQPVTTNPVESHHFSPGQSLVPCSNCCKMLRTTHIICRLIRLCSVEEWMGDLRGWSQTALRRLVGRIPTKDMDSLLACSVKLDTQGSKEWSRRMEDWDDWARRRG